MQIEKCKLGMREAVKECEESNGDRAIASEHIDELGEIDEKEIFCGRCHDPESYEVGCQLSFQACRDRGLDTVRSRKQILLPGPHRSTSIRAPSAAYACSSPGVLQQ